MKIKLIVKNFGMSVVYDLFFNKIQWQNVAFLSTNSAVNLRTDLIENEVINNGFYD